MTEKKNREEYLSPILITAQLFYCGVPFRMDSYSGCSHGCLYCFARAQDTWQTAKASRNDGFAVANPASVKRTFVKALDWSDKSTDPTIEWLRHRVPIHWGGMSDPFQPAEAKHRTTYDVMKYLNWYQYPCVVSTKGALAADDEYLPLIKEGNYAMQVSLITDIDELAEKIEPGAPNASQRLKILEKLAHAGIWTACRIQPVIPASPVEDGLERLIAKLANVGVKHIALETYKIPIHIPEKNRRLLDEACGGKVELEFHITGGEMKGMEILLPSWRKWKYIKPAIEATHKYGMTFGAADNEFRDVGDVKCCCGIDNVPGFENYWQYHTATAAEIAKRNGFVTLDDMDSVWSGEKTIQLNIQSDWRKECGVRKSWPAKFWMRNIWNLGDDRSPNNLINLDKVLKDGQIRYVYNNKLDKLDSQTVVQGALF